VRILERFDVVDEGVAVYDGVPPVFMIANADRRTLGRGRGLCFSDGRWREKAGDCGRHRCCRRGTALGETVTEVDRSDPEFGGVSEELLAVSG
jgi:hypothetical protein